jgi:hypothetical protein
MNADCQPMQTIEQYDETQGGVDLNYKGLVANNWTSCAVAIPWNISESDNKKPTDYLKLLKNL